MVLLLVLVVDNGFVVLALVVDNGIVIGIIG